MENMRLRTMYLATKIHGHAAEEDRWNVGGEGQTEDNRMLAWVPRSMAVVKIRNCIHWKINYWVSPVCQALPGLGGWRWRKWSCLRRGLQSERKMGANTATHRDKKKASVARSTPFVRRRKIPIWVVKDGYWYSHFLPPKYELILCNSQWILWILRMFSPMRVFHL